MYDERFERRGRGRSIFRGRSRGRTSQSFNKATVECFKCHKLGHFQYECPDASRKAHYAELEVHDEMLLMTHIDMQKGTQIDAWFLDSGCSNHMCGDQRMFTYLDGKFNHSVKLGSNNRMSVMGKGTVKHALNGIQYVIKDVYYVPELSNNMLSLGQLQENGLAILIQGGTCKIFHPERGLIIQATMSVNRMFILQVQHQENCIDQRCLHANSQDLTYLWHRRYGHLSHKGLHTLMSKGMVHGLPQFDITYKTCTDCMLGKQHRTAIPKAAL